MIVKRLEKVWKTEAVVAPRGDKKACFLPI